MKILDVIGHHLWEKRISGRNYTLEKGDLMPGIYFVQVSDERGNLITNKKVIIY